MKKIRLTNEEVKYVLFALSFYCDETTHPREDLGQGESRVGLNPNSKESKVLVKVINKLAEV